MPNEAILIAEPYEIVSIEPTDPPQGSGGKRWHRYVIVQGDNTINGYRQGSLGAVTHDVEEIVARLNERRSGKSGRVPLMTARKPSAQK